MRIVLLGATGFVGSALLVEALHRGWARGLKLRPEHHNRRPCAVATRVGAWIETRTAATATTPSRGRALARARGLKLQAALHRLAGLVAPSRGPRGFCGGWPPVLVDVAGD